MEFKALEEEIAKLELMRTWGELQLKDMTPPPPLKEVLLDNDYADFVRHRNYNEDRSKIRIHIARIDTNIVARKKYIVLKREREEFLANCSEQENKILRLVESVLEYHRLPCWESLEDLGVGGRVNGI